MQQQHSSNVDGVYTNKSHHPKSHSFCAWSTKTLNSGKLYCFQLHLKNSITYIDEGTRQTSSLAAWEKNPAVTAFLIACNVPTIHYGHFILCNFAFRPPIVQFQMDSANYFGKESSTNELLKHQICNFGNFSIWQRTRWREQTSVSEPQDWRWTPSRCSNLLSCSRTTITFLIAW
jgi:hypothetical protein